jgi:hypothetical protein
MTKKSTPLRSQQPAATSSCNQSQLLGVWRRSPEVKSGQAKPGQARSSLLLPRGSGIDPIESLDGTDSTDSTNWAMGHCTKGKDQMEASPASPASLAGFARDGQFGMTLSISRAGMVRIPSHPQDFPGSAKGPISKTQSPKTGVMRS